MRKFKIAAVSYLNTIPFLEGLKSAHSEFQIELILVPPSECAELFRKGLVDVSLSPIGALEALPPHKIITNFGIGCNGAVRTVALLSNEKLENIESVQFDPDSRTTNLLIQVLAKEYWRTNWEFYHSDDQETWRKEHKSARVAIGDKVFRLEREGLSQWDLGQVWKDWTGLPFVFAVWISHPGISPHFESYLNECFQNGVNAIERLQLDDLSRSYLLNNISYAFDKDKKKALSLFQNQVKKLTLELIT